MSEPTDRAYWERVAAAWTQWARTPGHDAFWHYRDALAAFTGAGTGTARALEVGCGEGRVSRLLKELGHRVTATDAVAALVDAAREAGSADRYVVAPATGLPFDAGSFDLVVAYNVLMDVEDMPGAVAEMARVLAPGGTVLISLVHPFRDRGRFAGPQPDAPFVVEGSYFGCERFEGNETRGGLTMAFAGWSQPLETYAMALERAGLAITSLREPLPASAGREEAFSQSLRMPLFLWLKAKRIA